MEHMHLALETPADHAMSCHDDLTADLAGRYFIRGMKNQWG